jgi:repressor of nif and glnA expression
MTRNWELIRKILVLLEESTTPKTAIGAKDLKEYPEQDVAYNIRLLSEAGYIEANISESNSKILLALARRLTNTGHDLLDTIRNDTVWGKIKDKFESKGMDMTFEMVISVGKTIVESILI